MRRFGSRLAVALSLWLAPPGAPAETLDPAALLVRIRAATLDASRAVALRNVSIQAGVATLHIEEGTLFPASPAGIRSAEMVFIGRARLVGQPPDETEADQLEIFTGSRSLDVPFEEAVLVVAKDEAADALLGRPVASPLAPEVAARAEDLYARWKGSAERKLLAVEPALLLDALGEPAREAYAVAWCESARLGRFVYLVDPDEREQATLGQFVPLDLTKRERRRQERRLLSEQRAGRLVGLDVDDLGAWDTWLASARLSADGRPQPASPAFEPVRYELDASILGDDSPFAARARLVLRALEAGRRAVPLALGADLEVDDVRDGEGNALLHLRARSEVFVILPGPTAPDESLTLEIGYRGNPVDRLQRGLFRLRDTSGWYPQIPGRAGAAYDVTLRWPRRHTLLASGRPVAADEEPPGRRWERRVFDGVPARAFSFELGDFDFATADAGHVAITVAFDKQLANVVPKATRELVAATCRDAVQFFEEAFGPFPLDHLSVVTAPRAFSQGFLGFVTLADAHVMLFRGATKPGHLDDDAATLGAQWVLAHEVAHQWWGNIVGWEGYRDQWLSEALASFSATEFLRARLSNARTYAADFAMADVPVWARGARGRDLDRLGPVTLGVRLESSVADEIERGSAYETVVYRKGAMVIDLLARLLGEERFREMLRQLVRAAGGRQLTTESFLAALEKMSGQDLDGYARRWIHGVGHPHLVYTHAFADLGEGRWGVEGEVRQHASYRARYRVSRTPSGALDVVRDLVDAFPVEDSVLKVPFQVTTGPSGKDWPPSRPTAPRKGFGGQIEVRGTRSSFRVELTEEPRDFALDNREEVLAPKTCATHRPRQALWREALDLEAGGRIEEAEAVLQRAMEEALEVVLPTERGGAPEDDSRAARRDRRADDAWILVRVAELRLTRNDEASAAETLERAIELQPGDAWPASSIEVLQARMEVRRGEYAAALKRLDRVRRRHGWGAWTSPQANALVAVASRATGDEEAFRGAMRRCREEGVDVSLLRDDTSPAATPR